MQPSRQDSMLEIRADQESMLEIRAEVGEEAGRGST